MLNDLGTNNPMGMRFPGTLLVLAHWNIKLLLVHCGANAFVASRNLSLGTLSFSYFHLWMLITLTCTWLVLV